MTDIYIYGTINNFALSELAGVEEDVTVHLNSYGGDVSAGLAIYNVLKTKNANIIVEGICASAATLAACGGKVTAAKNSLFMLHLPSLFLFDNYDETELDKVGRKLAAMKGAILETYAGKLTVDHVEDMLKAETWLTAEQAKQIGLVDVVDGEVELELDEETEELVTAQGRFSAKGLKLAGKVKTFDNYAAIATDDLSTKFAQIGKQAAVPAKVVSQFISAAKDFKSVGEDKIADIIKAHMTSGAEGVTGSTPAEVSNARRIANFF